MELPDCAPYVVIGGGIHGLSTAWHLARELTARGRGSGANVVIVDKADIGAGASGIACGVVRNNYFQPAMRELMAHSVEVWESDAEVFAYHGVGYLQISPEVMHEDVREIHAQQQAIGYPSRLIEEDDCRLYLQSIFPDWQAKNITSVLHEQRGGYANNRASIHGLATKARAAGVSILPGTRVTGLRLEGGRVTAVDTERGSIDCETVVVAVGPWIRDPWRMLDLPEVVPVQGRNGRVYQRPMWTYWSLQEGTLGVDPSFLTDSSGGMPPVVHVDTDAPLYDDDNGALITDDLWGVYFKPDFNFGGVQGGAMPFVIDRPADAVAVDPYGPASPDFIVGPEFARMWTAGLAHCLKRFEGKSGLFSTEPSGGIGCFTPDSFPVFDTFRENAYVIADSNHGYKMIGVGALVAKELMGERQRLLEPFRFSRYAEGRLHPVSHSPFPWS